MSYRRAPSARTRSRSSAEKGSVPEPALVEKRVNAVEAACLLLGHARAQVGHQGVNVEDVVRLARLRRELSSGGVR